MGCGFVVVVPEADERRGRAARPPPPRARAGSGRSPPSPIASPSRRSASPAARTAWAPASPLVAVVVVVGLVVQSRRTRRPRRTAWPPFVLGDDGLRADVAAEVELLAVVGRPSSSSSSPSAALPSRPGTLASALRRSHCSPAPSMSSPRLRPAPACRRAPARPRRPWRRGPGGRRARSSPGTYLGERGSVADAGLVLGLRALASFSRVVGLLGAGLVRLRVGPLLGLFACAC